MSVWKSLVALVALSACTMLPSPAAAQIPASRFTLGGSVSRSFTRDEAGAAVAIAAGHRVGSRLSVGAEASYIPHLQLGGYAACPFGRVCVAVVGGTLLRTTSAVSLGANLKAELASAANRVHPYLAVGGGVVHIEQRLRHQFYGFPVNATSNNPFVALGGGVEVWSRVGSSIGVRF